MLDCARSCVIAGIVLSVLSGAAAAADFDTDGRIRDGIRLHDNLGINLAKQRKLVEATRAFEENLARRPTHGLGWAALAQILEERQWASRALAAHARLLALRPERQLAVWSGATVAAAARRREERQHRARHGGPETQ